MDAHSIDDLQQLEKHVAEAKAMPCQQLKVVAIGEIGLDFWQAGSDRSGQLALFIGQLALAQKYDLPVLLHARKSHDDILKQIRRTGFSSGGIVHAFSGSRQQAGQYVSLGFKLGVGGGVTYPRAAKLRSTIKWLGVNHWVLETDAPDMPMFGRQGQINRPDYLPQVLAVLAELLQVPDSVLANQLWSNTEQVLGVI
jgi:TatD DNase family protein